MSRAVAPVLGTVLLVAVTVTLAAAVGAVALAVPATPATETPVVLSASVNASADRLTLGYESGPPIDVRTLRVRVSVDGTPLAYQPPVPFFRSPGFPAAPTGPFNSGADPRWTPGETTSLRLSPKNTPKFDPGSTVTVRVYRNDVLFARLVVSAT